MECCDFEVVFDVSCGKGEKIGVVELVGMNVASVSSSVTPVEFVVVVVVVFDAIGGGGAIVVVVCCCSLF